MSSTDFTFTDLTSKHLKKFQNMPGKTGGKESKTMAKGKTPQTGTKGKPPKRKTSDAGSESSSKAPDAVSFEICQSEGNTFRGMGMYKKAVNSYSRVIGFRDLLVGYSVLISNLITRSDLNLYVNRWLPPTPPWSLSCQAFSARLDSVMLYTLVHIFFVFYFISRPDPCMQI